MAGLVPAISVFDPIQTLSYPRGARAAIATPLLIHGARRGAAGRVARQIARAAGGRVDQGERVGVVARAGRRSRERVAVDDHAAVLLRPGESLRERRRARERDRATGVLDH